MTSKQKEFESNLTEEQKTLFFAISSQLQRHFCIELIKNNFVNQKDAYEKACKKVDKEPAKNSDKAASQIRVNSKVSAFIESVRAKKDEADISEAVGSFDQKRVMLWEVANRCAQNVRPLFNMDGSERLTEDKDGEIARAYTFDAKGLVSAVAELNKMDGDHAAQRIELGASDDLVAAIYAGRRRTKKDDK
ncbi:hypothetical protein [Vibrio parahaemolyticus]|uniref:hypothetical protein n=1 Tax=Vibrio parahaemolyticus TaxID=670 RepID=UPI002806C261|nr:hypothetical protein [Vibrio parahaemolyticus]